ncbi:MAG: DUF427 domain-containing protein [Sneathiella sp.]|nr:DUF427 domain-containing protein [Sneathiella sp.]
MKSAPGFQKHPDHKVEIERADGRLQLSLKGEVIATSDEALLLKEGDYPDRYYFPIHDIKGDILKPSDHHSYCPFKGTARYWDVLVGKDLIKDGAWGYDDPYFECADLTGYVCFYMEKAAFSLQKL